MNSTFELKYGKEIEKKWARRENNVRSGTW